jgi:putative transposase
MRRINKHLVGNTRRRMRSGGRQRDSTRYRRLIYQVRSIVKTRIVSLQGPAEIVVERLDFRMPGLSRRLNRLLSNRGRSVFKAKLADLKDRLGIESAEINPAYTSHQCSHCRYVARENRPSQSTFRCVKCGHTAHAASEGHHRATFARIGLTLHGTRANPCRKLHRRFGERPRRHNHNGQRGTKTRRVARE